MAWRDHKGLRAYDGFHGDVCFELFDNIARLLLLIPTDKRVEHENSNLSLRFWQKKKEVHGT